MQTGARFTGMGIFRQYQHPRSLQTLIGVVIKGFYIQICIEDKKSNNNSRRRRI